MASTYTPSATAAQAPSPAPDPGNVPTPVLPADADTANAASVAQAFKCLADRAAWEASPRAKASSWDQPVKAFMSAILNTGFMIDHLGYPAGQLNQWCEDWSQIAEALYLPAGPSGSSVKAGRWLVMQFTQGTLNVLPPSIGRMPTLSAALSCYAGANNTITLLSAVPLVFMSSEIALTMAWDAYLYGTELTSNEYFCGVSNNPFPGAGAISALTPQAVGFIKRTGDANWFCYSKGGGAPVYTDTGVAVAGNTRVRMRVELVGPPRSDDTNPQVHFYLNGTRIAAAPLNNLGLLSTAVSPFFRNIRVVNGTLSTELLIGCIRWSHNLWAGDARL